MTLSVNNYFQSKLRNISSNNSCDIYRQVRKQFRMFKNPEPDVIKIDCNEAGILTYILVFRKRSYHQ